MNIRWDYFVNQYDTSRYVPASDGRDNKHILFVRDFASVVSVLQVDFLCVNLIRQLFTLSSRIKQIVSSTCTKTSYEQLKISQHALIQQTHSRSF